MHRDDTVTASRCLQLTAIQRANTEVLARDLSGLLDRYFVGVMNISDSPSGSVDDGLPLDRERIGPLKIGSMSFDIGLVRVNDPQAGPIWLFSSETLAEVPVFHRSIEETWAERTMPRTLVKHAFLGMSLAQWIFWLASIAIPLIGSWFLSKGLIILARRMVVGPSRRKLLDSWHAGLRWPLIALLTLIFHSASLVFVGFGLKFRITYGRFLLVGLIGVLTWLLWVLLTLSFERARSLVQRWGRAEASSLMLLGERALKVIIVLVAILSMLSIAGVDTKTALAGVGIGGVAIALGAQKSVENLLGGVFLLSDRALAVGDFCNLGNRAGTVEDITLRSVRLRTVEQTLLSVPAGVLSQANIENFSSRNKILAQTTLRLRYGTTADQLRSILDGIRTLLAQHSALEPASSRIRLVDFGIQAIELELFAYVMTSDFQKFLSVREDLLLQIASIVESSGSGFAQPTQFIYAEGTANVDGRLPGSVAAQASAAKRTG
jgi:MscS family membrane protein